MMSPLARFIGLPALPDVTLISICGIAGFWSGGKSAMLARTATAIAHRGPDDVGEWYSPGVRVGLTHRRLSIIVVFASVAGRVTVTALSRFRVR